MRLRLIPALGKRLLGKLTLAELDKLWKAKREAGYSANSVRIMRPVMRRALGQAEREGLVTRDVAALSSTPRLRAREGRTLTIEQARHLFDAVSDHRLGPAILLALIYGLRRGEALGLHWSALDRKNETLLVTHSVKRIKNRDRSSSYRTRLVVAELKRPKSRRILALTPEITAKLRQHRARQARSQDRSRMTEKML